MRFTEARLIKKELMKKGYHTKIVQVPTYDGWTYALYTMDNVRLNIEKVTE